MLITHIYHQLLPTCFCVFFIIFQETIALFCSRNVFFLQCCHTGCAMKYKTYPNFLNLQCLLQCLKQYVVRFFLYLKNLKC